MAGDETAQVPGHIGGPDIALDRTEVVEGGVWVRPTPGRSGQPGVGVVDQESQQFLGFFEGATGYGGTEGGPQLAHRPAGDG